MMQLSLFESCAETRQYLQDAISYQLLQPTMLYAVDTQGKGDAVAGIAEDNSADRANPDAVSKTNVQEEGVDEADKVKTSSTGMLYLLRGNNLVIVDAFPAAGMNATATLQLPVNAQELYLSKDEKQVIVLGPLDSFGSSLADAKTGSEAIMATNLAAEDRSWQPRTRIVYVDVRDAVKPVIRGYIDTDGWQVDSRLINNQLYLVTRPEMKIMQMIYQDDQLNRLIQATYDGQYEEGTVRDDSGAVDGSASQPVASEPPALAPAPEDPATGSNYLEYAVRQRVGQLLAGITDKDLLAVVGTDEEQSPLACSQTYHANGRVAPGLVLVSAYDITAETLTGSTDMAGILSDINLIYAATDTLYLAQTSGSWWWWSGAVADQTVLYRFDLAEALLRYRGAGVVAGWALNRYTLSEYKDDLRVVTTVSGSENNDWISSTSLSVLRPDASGSMKIIGAVHGLAPGEQVYSVRFMGATGFVVTFRQVDPLFTFDLSDPASPKQVAALKIPGFSSYMHPITDGYLLTLGEEGTEQGLTGRMAIQMFDIRDLAHPKLVDRYVPPGEWSWSAASYDPHAFTWLPELQLFAIPAAWYVPASDSYFSGMLAFRVDPQQGIIELGGSNHAELANKARCETATLSQSQWQSCQNGDFIWQSTPDRGVFMTSVTEALLYSISPAGIMASPVTDLSVVAGSLSLPEPWFMVY